MEKRADTADISLLFFFGSAHFLAVCVRGGSGEAKLQIKIKTQIQIQTQIQSNVTEE